MNFARTTFGPSGGITDPNKGSLIADVQTPVIEMVDAQGNKHGMESTLLQLQAQTALATITTAQTLMSLAFLAGALNQLNRTLRIRGMVIFTVASGTPTCTIAIKLGTVTLFTVTTAALAASTNGQIYFDVEISVAAAGSSGTLEAHGTVKAQLSTALGTALAEYPDQNVAVSSAVNLTAALTLAATIAASGTMSAAQLRLGSVKVSN